MLVAETRVCVLKEPTARSCECTTFEVMLSVQTSPGVQVTSPEAVVSSPGNGPGRPSPGAISAPRSATGQA